MTLRKLFQFIKSDVENHNGKSFKKVLFVFFLDAKFRLLLNYRLGKFFSESKYKSFRILAAYYKYNQITKRNCQISYQAELGFGVVFKHPIGVVIGDNVVVGDEVKIWQQVTIGSHGKAGQAFSYPIIEREVRIFAGAKVFGNIIIGSGATIGANSVVNTSVIAGDTVGGIPAKSLNQKKS